MKEVIITNIEVKDKNKLFQEMKKFMNYPINMLNTLLTEKEIYLDEDTYHRFKICENISFDDNEETEQANENDDIWYRPTVNEDGNIENKQGLTESEKWFNSLSDREKDYVRYLANNNFSNIPMC